LLAVQAIPLDTVSASKLVSANAETPFPAPLAGTIVKLIAEPGQTLQEGAVLLVMEAMKMEAEIRVPCTGILHRYHVQPGDLIAQGATLAGFMPLESTRR
jgi:biotin carboxyl carrier protein